MSANEEPRTLRIRVVLTVEIDRGEWEAAYGPSDAATIREDVRSAVNAAVATDGVVAAAGIIRDVR